MTNVIFISIPVCGRLALHSSNRRACARWLRRVDCERQSQPAAIPATAPRYELSTTKPFQGREYFSNIFETRRSIRFSTLSREASSAQLRGDRRGDAFANEGVVGLLNVLEAVGPEAGEVMPPSPCGDPTITVRGRRRRRLPGVLSSG